MNLSSDKMVFDPDLLKSTLALLSRKTATTIFIFDRSDHYMCFEKDAEIVSSKVFQTTAFIKQMSQGDKKIPYLTLNKNQYQRVIKDLLLIHQYRVELYQNRSRTSVWDLIAKASPGNLQDFEEILADSSCASENTAVVALKFVPGVGGAGAAAKHIAVACCDITNQRFIVSEFPDTIHFNTLQAFLVQVGPKEFLLPTYGQDADYKAVEPVLRRFGIVTHKKSGDFAPGDVIQDLNRLLKFRDDAQRNSLALPETKLSGAMGCVAALISYLKLLLDPSAFNRFKLEKAAFGQFMRLDANVVRSLGLFELSGSYNVKDTLYGLLNRCRTAPGKRLLDQWIKMPLLDVNKINERLDIVEVLERELEVSRTLSNLLARFPDVQRLSKNFLKKRATLLDLYKLYQAVRLIPNVINAIQKIGDDDGGRSLEQCVTERLQELQRELSKLADLVVFSLDLENIRHNEIYVKPSRDENLLKKRNKMKTVEGKIQEEAEKAADAFGLQLGKSLKLDCGSPYGYHFRVTNKDEKIIRDKKDIQFLISKKGGYLFRTTQLTKLNDEHAELKHAYEEIQEKIVAEILKHATSYFDPLQRFCSVMALLDVLQALATVARERSYVRPQILEKETGVLELKGARHPCLETHDNLPFIPNDVYFEKGKTEFLLITGPNMGGKSTYLRQTGLIVLMAQIGCFVPCSSARISVVDAIFARVGASDAQLEGASTFRMEMMEMASILETATDNSLILIDELGRGTSTYDGCSLAWSIAEHIAKNMHCWCMFATHFHELTALDIDLPMVKNLHVEADIRDGRFTLLYNVKEGPCGSSFGVHIAQAMNLPKSVIKAAAAVLDDFAWADSDGKQEQDENAMECEPASNTSDASEELLLDRTLQDSSAASFVTEVHRIVKNDRIYSTTEEKACALRNLLTKTTRKKAIQ